LGGENNEEKKVESTTNSWVYSVRYDANNKCKKRKYDNLK
jgi:hypothetical protein